MMAQPVAYHRTKDFTVDFLDETDHSAINAELDGVANSINDIRENLALIQADDGALRPGCVTRESISDELAAELVKDIDEYAFNINDAAVKASEAAKEAAKEAAQQAEAARKAAEDATDALAHFSIDAHKETLLQWVFDAIHPIGSVYLTFGEEDPATRFGGTWVRIAAGTCLVSAGDAFACGETYGANSKAISVDNLPTHSHGGTTGAAGAHSHLPGTMGTASGSIDLLCWAGMANKTGVFAGSYLITSNGFGASPAVGTCARLVFNGSVYGATSSVAGHTHTLTTDTAGAGNAFDVMQSSIAINIWRRTA